ncbi:hypothetical protein Ddc_23268 [Ditylenchus destructor]|nr:hypothetical protein Ddc_23268 [Ditylenchus destructor]
MSYSKPLPPFTFDVLCYLNRDQLERFSIVCRPLKNLIERYFHSKPYRIFDELEICGGSYALFHNLVQWHPNRDDYSVQQFLTGQECNIDKSKQAWDGYAYYSFSEMRPYLGPTVRIKSTNIASSMYSYSLKHIKEMESISYLWRDGKIGLRHTVSEDFQLILNSPIILQCQRLLVYPSNYFFKDYKVLYTVKVIESWYAYRDVDPNCWMQFFEQAGVKPVVVLWRLNCQSIDNVLDCLSKAFSSAVSPNAFKIVFAQTIRPLTEFRETNSTSREMLELKKGLPTEYQLEGLEKHENYTLERSSI